MRWPFRRRTTPIIEPGAEPSAHPDRAAERAPAPRPAPSRPRFDWARLPAMPRTVHVEPPVTFHGDRFGRSVAGARAIDHSTRPRSHRRDIAPSGLMLDIVQVETVEPVAERSRPEVPPVRPEPLTNRSRHAPHVHRSIQPRPLTTAAVTLGFEPPPDRQRPMPRTVSWTADRGFVEDGAATSDGPDADDPATPRLRYVPTTEQRHERPSRDLVDLVHRATGVDVGDAVIDRSAAVSERAAELGAVAFTERGTVHLPAELGDVGEPGVRGVVAHELTHVAQQRARRSEVPSEDSGEGRELEAEARAVQQAAAGAVRPTVLRRRAHAPRTLQGVQRLADDDDDGRRFAWQGRSEEHSPSQTRSALGLFGGYTWRQDSVGDRALRREDEDWRRDFEREHRDDLLATRREHYEELLARRLELARARLPESERDDVELGRREVLAAREQLDRDMPFEFELPADVDVYPGVLPEPGPDDDDAAADHPADRAAVGDGHGEPGPSAPRRVPVTGAAASGASAASTTRTGRPATPGAHRPGGAAGPGRGSARTTASAPGFDWQHREPTEQQTVAALFGGGLLGDLLGRAVGEETDDDRRAAEALHLPQLLERRQEQERQLRHRRLREKLRVRETEARREERHALETPVSLTDEEITAIREQIDREMPLEFAVPTYLDADTEITIDVAGQITDGRAEPEPDAGATEAGAPGEPAATPTDGTAPAETPATPPAPESADDSTDVTGADAAGAGRGRTAAGSLLAGATLVRAADGVIGGDDDGEERDTGAAVATLLSSASDYDIDVLSRRVWSRIRREMRGELLVDRERAGALADHR